MKIIINILIIFSILIIFKYIKIKGVSLIGILARKIISCYTCLTKNHRIKLEMAYKKLNDMTGWKVKEGKYRNFYISKVNIDYLEGAMLTPIKNNNKKVLLQLHGGGYEIDLPNNNLYFAKKYAKLLKNIGILTINYRVAPKYKYPAALDDAINAYKWLIDTGYDAKDIIIVGDSAGGGLAIATTMYLRDHNMPLPRAIVTMSAWTDLTNKERSFKENFNIDPVFGKNLKSIIIKSTYAKGMNKKDPYISPMYGSFRGFPNMLMQVGTHEMLYSDTIDLAKKAVNDEVDVKVSVYKGMFHIFQSYKGFIPEADRAWNEVKRFILSVFGL